MTAPAGRAFPALVLVYLAAALVLGGASAAGLLANTALQVAGALLIGMTIARGQWPPASGALRRFAIALALLALVQFTPLPPALWVRLPGRLGVAAGFDLLGMTRPWLSLSLAPWYSLTVLASAIPPLALFLVMRGQDAPPMRQVVALVVGVALVSVVIGLVQQTRGLLYFYAVTNYGLGPGFFANSNHQSCFLLMALALGTGALAINLHAAPHWAWSRLPAVAAALALVAGVIANRSLACLALLPVEAVALAALLHPRWRRPLLLTLPLAAVAAPVVAVLGPFGNDLTGQGAVPGISRGEFLAHGLRILHDFAPFGSGLGSFADIYSWYEDSKLAGPIHVNHAHDDLLELLIETGVFGALAIVCFVLWLAPCVNTIWRRSQRDPLAQAASLVVAIALFHSLVDYPLRTEGLACLFAVCCAAIDRSAARLASTTLAEI